MQAEVKVESMAVSVVMNPFLPSLDLDPH